MAGWRNRAAMASGYIAAIAVAGMMLITVADVVLRAVFNFPIRGTLEIVELMLACSFFLALPGIFLRDENIVVDLIDQKASSNTVTVLKRLSALVGALMLAVLLWQGWISAQDTLVFNDVTADLSIPRIYYWMPVLAGLAGSILAAIAMIFDPHVKRGSHSGGAV